jgi:hypothetical protein
MLSHTGVTLMLKISWVRFFADALAGLMRSEGLTWS